MIYSHYLDGFFLKSWEKVYRLLGLEPHILILYTPPEWAVEQCINHDIEWIKSNTRLFWQPRALRKYQRSMSAKQQQFLNSWQKYMDVLREWCDETTNSHIIWDITQLRSQSELVERLSDIGLSPSAEGAEWTIPDRKQVSKYADTSIQALHTYFMHSSK